MAYLMIIKVYVKIGGYKRNIIASLLDYVHWNQNSKNNTNDYLIDYLKK